MAGRRAVAFPARGESAGGDGVGTVVAEQARLAAVWAFRAHAEQGARARFAVIAALLRRCHEDDALTREAHAASEDELRHEGICRRLADSLGGAAPPPDADLPDLASPSWTPYQHATFALVASCCVTESINAAVLGASLARCDHPPARAALRELLRDEVRHAQLGWAQLELARSRIDLAFLAPRIPQVFEQTFRADFFRVGPAVDARDEALGARWGVLPHSASVAVVRGVVMDAVLPGLDRVGVDTGDARAWWSANAAPP